tara:strand:- start:1222 stop:1779 length:558 start_codon:yes stop_codon:yes gene_type:complete
MRLKKFNFKIVNSTNDIAIRIIRNTNNKFGIINADKQKKGRGQHGKRWISNKGNLFISIFFSLEKIDMSLQQLTKTNCFLIKKILSRYYKKKISIKFPNDLLINKKKICGILQEKLKKANTNYIIVGIGINLIKSPYIKNYPTTNLFELTKIKVNKKEIISDLKNIYEEFIDKFSKSNFKTLKSL